MLVGLIIGTDNPRLGFEFGVSGDVRSNFGKGPVQQKNKEKKKEGDMFGLDNPRLGGVSAVRGRSQCRSSFSSFRCTPFMPLVCQEDNLHKNRL